MSSKQILDSSNKSKRVLALMTDAYGGHGGISRFNRDFIEALAADSNCSEIVVFPRIVTKKIEEKIPSKVKFINKKATTKISYIKLILSWLRKDSSFDMIICGHINLLPLAWLLAKFLKISLVMIIHGIDAWTPTPSRLTNFLSSKVDCVVAVSRISLERFCSWSGISRKKSYILPNCVDLTCFTPGPKDQMLVKRYGLDGKRALMTLGRMPGRGRQKGFDEVLELMPDLIKEIPDLMYVLAGDGPDRPRLERKAQELGVSANVVFTGLIDECEKAGHYRLADVYVMPSQGEGFGIVLLEAMSCGIPVVASRLDGGCEALRDGSLGVLVDPLDKEDIQNGIRQALATRRHVPEGLDYYSIISFRDRVSKLIGFIEGNKFR